MNTLSEVVGKVREIESKVIGLTIGSEAGKKVALVLIGECKEVLASAKALKDNQGSRTLIQGERLLGILEKQVKIHDERVAAVKKSTVEADKKKAADKKELAKKTDEFVKEKESRRKAGK